MARNTGPKCRLCRREGLKLFLKGTRCDTARCAIERREYPPGMHSWPKRSKVTAYGLQLREKQKVKRYYGLLETPFRMVFHRAERQKGNTGDNLLVALESRFDNIAVALGFARSHSDARQVIRHGHLLVNGRRVTVAAQPLKAGDQITPANRDKSKALIAANLEIAKGRQVPTWLEVSLEPPLGNVLRTPTREDISLPVQEQLIVELLSK